MAYRWIIQSIFPWMIYRYVHYVVFPSYSNTAPQQVDPLGFRLPNLPLHKTQYCPFFESARLCH